MVKWLISVLLLVLFPLTDLPAADMTGTLQQIRKTGKIRIGYRDAQPPLSSRDKAGKAVGYSLDLCREIVAEVNKTVGRNVDVEFLVVTAENRFAALNDNKVDLLCGADTRTLSRGEKVDFTLTTFVTGASFLAFRDANIRGNFNGKRIGVVKGTTTAAELKKLLAETNVTAEVVEFDTTGEGKSALEKGKLDAFSADQVVLIGLALASENPLNFVVLPNLFSFEPFALVTRRNDADFRLVADRALARLYRSRAIMPIYDKWFGSFSATPSDAFEAMVRLNALPE